MNEIQKLTWWRHIAPAHLKPFPDLPSGRLAIRMIAQVPVKGVEEAKGELLRVLLLVAQPERAGELGHLALFLQSRCLYYLYYNSS